MKWISTTKNVLVCTDSQLVIEAYNTMDQHIASCILEDNTKLTLNLKWFVENRPYKSAICEWGNEHELNKEFIWHQ